MRSNSYLDSVKPSKLKLHGHSRSNKQTCKVIPFMSLLECGEAESYDFEFGETDRAVVSDNLS